MKYFLNNDKLKVLITTNMTYLTTLIDNNGKLAINTGKNIYGIYSYLDTI